MYHILLRTSALTLAFVLLFQSGLLAPVTHELANNAGSYVASTVGMSAAVAPNEHNTITAELTRLRTDLEARERVIAERELEIGLASGADRDYSTFILSAILFLFLVLIILNYVLDYLRERRPQVQGYEEQPA